MQRENVFGNKMQYPKVFLYHYPEDNYNDHCSSFIYESKDNSRKYGMV